MQHALAYHLTATAFLPLPCPPCNVKVVRADLRWIAGQAKPELTPSEQLYICLTESTANVDYVLHTVKRRWGEDQVLVTADGLKVEDSAGTQG